MLQCSFPRFHLTYRVLSNVLSIQIQDRNQNKRTTCHVHAAALLRSSSSLRPLDYSASAAFETTTTMERPRKALEMSRDYLNVRARAR